LLSGEITLAKGGATVSATCCTEMQPDQCPAMI
jgi:hypothetical protein